MTIRAENLTKRYRQGEKEVVALLSFTYAFPPGATAVVGPSGSGKTTLLNLLAGFDLPTEGGVYLGDIPLHALSEDERAGVRLRHMGFVFQQWNLIPTLTALENVAFPLLLAGWPRRARLARAADPPIVFADEPTGNLDLEAREQVADLLFSLGKARTLVLVTHDLELAQRAGRILHLKGGRLVREETPKAKG